MKLMPTGVVVTSDAPHLEEVLTPEALDFAAQLHRSFNPERERLLADRVRRQARLDAGETPDFLPNPIESRDPEWRVAPAPADFDDRRVEITGPAEPKMMINALNSGASVFMCDFEDALSPTWSNVVTGHWSVGEAVRRRLSFQTDEKAYALDDRIATLCIRPRGWHLLEAHVTVDGAPISASIFDFGIWFFHNARELIDRGSGPYLYLPKLESHLEAALWDKIFGAAQEALGVPHGSVRATVLIETILAAFEMDEILFELRDHAAGLNAGRWDYIFSIIKKFRTRPDMVLPDRRQVTMTVPVMRAYTELLVQTCHRRGAHAIGGMAAFIPSRRDAEANERALSAVRADKERESGDGFDGTWVAHPDLVPVAREVFDEVLGSRINQKERLRPEVRVSVPDLLDVSVPGSAVSEAGVRSNVSIGLSYLASWLAGNGAAAINNLMEDAATAEISRSQLWQWRVHGTPLDDGQPLTADRYAAIRDVELAKLRSASPDFPWTDASALLDDLVLSDDFAEFLTLGAYPLLA
jgi:malate synthase